MSGTSSNEIAGSSAFTLDFVLRNLWMRSLITGARSLLLSSFQFLDPLADILMGLVDLLSLSREPFNLLLGGQLGRRKPCIRFYSAPSAAVAMSATTAATAHSTTST
jgi:hypothetical protein